MRNKNILDRIERLMTIYADEERYGTITLVYRKGELKMLEHKVTELPDDEGEEGNEGELW